MFKQMKTTKSKFLGAQSEIENQGNTEPYQITEQDSFNTDEESQ